jgi:hypothetical protein
VAVYLDIEGLPDRGFDYLIGTLVVKEGVRTEYSFRADDPGQERAVWADCLRVIEGLGDCTIYHYGRYESRFLDRMKRSAVSEDEAAAVLDHDGVPWNSNNAENAVKRFVSRRKMIGASFNEKGLRDYLVFLSIYQTCRNKHLSFLRFLRSEGLDLDLFAEAGAR